MPIIAKGLTKILTVFSSAAIKVKWLTFLVLSVTAQDLWALECAPLTTELSQKTNAFLQPLNGYDSFQSITDADLALSCNHQFLNAKMDPWLRNDAPYSVGGDRQDNRLLFDLKEAWIELAGDNADLRVGNQIVSWGANDAINPTDVWNPSDLIDPFNPVKLPVEIIKLSVHPLAMGHLIWDFLASPQFRPHRLPIDVSGGPGSTRSLSPTDSRWLIQSPRVANFGGGVSLPVQYEILGSSKPTDWQLGTRLRFMSLASWDFSLSYSQTTYELPAITTKVHGTFGSPTLPVLISVQPNFYRVSTTGFDLSGVIGTVGVRAEGAIRTPVGSGVMGVPDQNTWVTGGLDRSFFIGKVELYLNAIFVFEDGTSVSNDPNALSTPSFEPWNRDLVIASELRFSRKTALGLRSINSFVDEDAWLHPYATFQASDFLKIELGADLFLGSALGFFGQYADNNRLTTAVTSSF